jgi:hypothetical protein
MDKTKFICENCKVEFYARPQDKRGKHIFCSMKCQHEWRTGKTDLIRKKGIYKECPVCGNGFYCYPYEVDIKKTCSRECKGEYESLLGIHQAENSNFWAGGFDNYRGKNWYNQRNKARDRDNNSCQVCGKTSDEQEYKIIVHHKVPFRFFQNDYKKANDLENLICVCHNCHAIQESHQWHEVPVEYHYLLKGLKPQLKPPAGKRYSKEEMDFIKKNYDKMEYKELALIMGRTQNSLSDKILELGLRKDRYTVFSRVEIKYIINNYPTKGEKFFKEKLPHIKYNTIKSFCNRKGIVKIKHNTERSL